MNIAFYNGVSGMVSYQNNLNLVSHNIANVNTVGYKAERMAFEDLLYTKMALNGEEEHLVGHGVRPIGTDLIYEQAPLIPTGKPLDYALMGDGFFALEGADGAVSYTRNGAFDISVEGTKGYLVSTDGSYVLDSKGKHIQLERPDTKSPFDLEGVSDRLGVYTFPNPYGLEPRDGTKFLPTDISGTATAVSGTNTKKSDLPYKIIPNALEQSSVQLADEMVNVIVSQKAFQFSAKMVQTADEVEEVINNLR